MLQLAAVLSLLSLLFQFVTAGQILSDSQVALLLHGDGAIAFHVVTGLAMLAAATHWRTRRARSWPTVVIRRPSYWDSCGPGSATTAFCGPTCHARCC